MRVDFSQPFMQSMEPDKVMLDGPPPVVFTCDECGHTGEAKDERDPVTLKAACCNALMSMDPQSKMSGEEKVKRYNLATRIVKGDPNEVIRVEEIVLLKKVIGEIYNPVIVGQAFRLLDGAEADKKPETDEAEEKVAGKVPAEE